MVSYRNRIVEHLWLQLESIHHSTQNSWPQSPSLLDKEPHLPFASICSLLSRPVYLFINLSNQSGLIEWRRRFPLEQRQSQEINCMSSEMRNVQRLASKTEWPVNHNHSRVNGVLWLKLPFRSRQPASQPSAALL